MKLMKQIVVKSLEQWDETRLNKKFNPRIIYPAIIISSIYVGISIENAQYTNELYKQYCTAKLEGDKRRIRKYMTLLDAQIAKDRMLTHKLLELTKTTEEDEDEGMKEFYSDDSFGFLASEDSD